jgi:hypothetical protein
VIWSPGPARPGLDHGGAYVAVAQVDVEDLTVLPPADRVVGLGEGLDAVGDRR